MVCLNLSLAKALVIINKEQAKQDKEEFKGQCVD